MYILYIICRQKEKGRPKGHPFSLRSLAAAATGIVAVVAATTAGQQENEDDDPSAVVSAKAVTHIVSPLSCSQHHTMAQRSIGLQKSRLRFAH